MAKGDVIVRLTPEEARHVLLNADGWLDAGHCEGGLEPDERAALKKMSDQILKKLGGKLKGADKCR